jgi:hypothetical protein
MPVQLVVVLERRKRARARARRRALACSPWLGVHGPAVTIGMIVSTHAKAMYNIKSIY